MSVTPFGGETSVAGGLSPATAGYAGVIALDLRRMNALVALDEESRIAVLEPGLRGPEAEAMLRARGYTIGRLPQSFEYGTLRGFAAACSSGQASAGYGRFDDLVLSGICGRSETSPPAYCARPRRSSIPPGSSTRAS